MLQARTLASSLSGMGVWFPSPSEYDALSFTLSLTDAYCTELMDRLHTDLLRRLRGYVSLVLALVVMIILYNQDKLLVELRYFGYFGTRHYTPPLTWWLNAFLVPLVVGGFTYFVSRYLISAFAEFFPQIRLIRDAESTREAPRYTAKFSSSKETSAGTGSAVSQLFSVGTRSANAQGSLPQRPITLSGLTTQLRQLIETTAIVLRSPVVILIDELDKLSDLDRFRQLLRDIKSIFEIPGVTVLVSISEEAGATFTRPWRASWP